MLRDLLAHPGVVEKVQLEGPLGVMAIHGGIEAGTAELALQVANATGSSHYIVAQPEDLAWHIPSTRYRPDDSPALDRFLGHVRAVVSVHGFGRAPLEHTILVGGRNRTMARAVAAALRRHTDVNVVGAIAEMPKKLRGVHPSNPVNLAPSRGVQLEMSASTREPHIRRHIGDVLSQVVLRQAARLAGAP